MNCEKLTNLRFNPFTGLKSELLLNSPSGRFHIKANSVPECCGHTLIFSDLEIFSMAELGADDYSEMLELQGKCENLLYETYGKTPIVIEHGSGYNGQNGRAASCVKEAHRHIAFIIEKVLSRMLCDCNWKIIDGYEELRTFAAKPYIYLKAGGAERITTQIPERQYGIKRIADKDDNYIIGDIRNVWQNRILVEPDIVNRYLELEAQNLKQLRNSLSL